MSLKKSAVGLLVFGLIVVAGAGVVGTLSKGFKDWNYKEWFGSSSSAAPGSSSDATVGYVNNGITLTPKFADDSNTKSFSYVIGPTYSTGQNVGIKVEYADASDASTIQNFYDVTLDQDAKTVSIAFKAICSKQVNITLYSIDNPTVNCVVTIDYKMKITSVTSALVANAGAPISVTDTVVASAGSIATSTAVSSKALTYNAAFIAQLKTSFAAQASSFCTAQSGTGATFSMTAADTAAVTYTGLTSVYAANYTAQAFLDSFAGTFPYHFASQYGSGTGTFTANMAKMGAGFYTTWLNGSTKIFDYSCMVAGVTYSAQFGLSVSSAAINSITPSSAAIVF